LLWIFNEDHTKFALLPFKNIWYYMQKSAKRLFLAKKVSKLAKFGQKRRAFNF
jgi:hypothetical protein